MLTLPLSFPSIESLATAYRTAGGTIGTPAAEAAPPSSPSTVNCAGTPPTYFDKWTYRPTDQLPNLYKGVVDMVDVVGVQAPSQQKGWTRLDVIQSELKDVEFAGAHCAEWYMKPENLAAFLVVCPSGYLVFLEKYRIAGRRLGVVCLFVHGGVVHVAFFYADAGYEFDAQDRFAVRRKLNA